MREDGWGWLLPDARAEETPALRRVITALRLLREDARASASRRASPSWQRARAELEALERRRRRRAIEVLLGAYLAALRPAGSFLDVGQGALAYGLAWRTLLAAGGDAGFPPAPGEAPRAVIERLVDAGAASGAPPHWRAWWETCLRHVTGPRGEAERHWDSALRAALASGAPPPVCAQLVSGLAAAHLDRFRPAEAWALHERHRELVLADAGLRRLLGWSALLCGEEAHARALLAAAPETVLPAPLAELRDDWPGWAPLLRGPAAPSGSAASPGRGARAELGAILVGAFAFRRGGATALVALDAPAALHAVAEQRCGSGWRPAGLETGALQRRRRRTNEPELPDALAGGATRALALAGVRDGGGELAGWIQLESAHQLLPSAPIVAAVARACSAALLERGAERAPASAAAPGLRREPFAPGDPGADFARRLFAALGPPAGRRAYWIEPTARDEVRVRAEFGTVLRDWPAAKGGAGIALRASAEARAARHHGEPGDALHAAAVAGVALPLVDPRGPDVLGVLVLESARAEALSAPVVEAVAAALARLEPVWWATAFRAACRARHGRDVAWDPSARFFSSLAPVLEAAGESSAPLLLVGEPGSGRRTLARWLHFRAARPGCVPGDDASVLDLAELAPEAQLALVRTAGERPRRFFLGAAPAHVLRERGALARELERMLEPLPLLVPPLRERRDEIPALVRVLAAEAARAASLRPPAFDDEALADLWRQEWRGNVRALAALVTQLARAFPGRTLGSAEVRAALRSRGLAFRARLPSRRPLAGELELALASTRHAIGSPNLARAARYLGWDPATLRARLEERGASAVSLADAPPEPSRRADRREATLDGGPQAG